MKRKEKMLMYHKCYEDCGTMGWILIDIQCLFWCYLPPQYKTSCFSSRNFKGHKFDLFKWGNTLKSSLINNSNYDKRSQEIAISISSFATYPNWSWNTEKLDDGNCMNLPCWHAKIGCKLLVMALKPKICKLCNFN